MNAPFDPLDERRVSAIANNLMAGARQDLGLHAAILTAAAGLVAAKAAGAPDRRAALGLELGRFGTHAKRWLALIRPAVRPTHPPQQGRPS